MVVLEHKGITAMPDGGRQLTREIDLDALAAFGDWEEGTPELGPASQRRPGRGAVSNPAPRFEATTTVAAPDDWTALTADLPPLQTILSRDKSKSAISWNDSPDLGFDRAVNPYRGCEHGCVYCYARPSHAYLGFSPGLEFETQIVYKPNVAALLEHELSRPGYVPRTMALGSNTDPYQPVDRTLRLTRAVLEVLDRYNHPVSIVTKSAGVLRDLDVLTRMAARGLVRVWVSVTTLDGDLARRMEPRASSPALRLQTLRALQAAGVPAGVLAAPMIPGLNDMELEQILRAARDRGVTHAGYVLLRLPHELRDIFTAWLHEHVPGRAQRVLTLIRDTRAGDLNDSQFGKRFVGEGPYAVMLGQRFKRVQRELGFAGRERLDATQFRAPARPVAQLSLL